MGMLFDLFQLFKFKSRERRWLGWSRRRQQGKKNSESCYLIKKVGECGLRSEVLSPGCISVTCLLASRDIRPHPWSTESEPQPSDISFKKFCKWFWCAARMENHWSKPGQTYFNTEHEDIPAAVQSAWHLQFSPIGTLVPERVGNFKRSFERWVLQYSVSSEMNVGLRKRR